MIEFDEAFLEALEARGARPRPAPARAVPGPARRPARRARPRPGLRRRLAVPGAGAAGRARRAGDGRRPGTGGRCPAAGFSDGAAPGVLAFESADGHALPFADGAFDAAACVSVLAFCDDPRRAGRAAAGAPARGAPAGRQRRRGHPGLQRPRPRPRASRPARPRRPRPRSLAGPPAGPPAGRRRLPSAGRSHPGGARAALPPGHVRLYPGPRLPRLPAHRGGVAAEDYARWLADLRACEWEGAYSYGVTTYAYLAERPPER